MEKDLTSKVNLSKLFVVVAVAAACGALEANEAPASVWRFRYLAPAEWSTEGWRKASLPLGNGWFGGVDVERLQLTEPSFQTRQLLYDRRDWPEGNLTDAADVAIDLERRVWPALHGMADFLTRCVAETNGLWLSTFSASPEQMHTRKMRKTHGVYCHTVGCAFDQQMIEVNNAALVRFGGKPWQDVIVRKE